MHQVRVARDRWNFELVGTGKFISPIGGNVLNDVHPVHGTLFDRFDAADCDRRLGAMADLGCNCLRQPIGVNHVFSTADGLKAEGMKNWDTFLRLAENHGIYLMPVGGYVGGNDWFDAEKVADRGRALDESCAFWEAFCGHYADHPAIWAWDLRNELHFATTQHLTRPGAADAAAIEAMLKDRWGNWLEARYGTVAEMNRHYGTSCRFFDEAPGSIAFENNPFDLRAFDFLNYLNDRGYAWCKRQCEVIRAVSPSHMIVSGNNGWLFPDMDLMLSRGFHNRALHDLFDFVTIHPYPAPQCLPGGRGDPLDGGAALRFWLNACVCMARIDHYGKPVVIQEYGWYGGGPSTFLCDLPERSEREHAEYTQLMIETLALHANGFLNWPVCDMPEANDISNHGGFLTRDGKPKALAGIYEWAARGLSGKRHARARATTTLRYSLLGLYTSRAYQDRFWEEATAAVADGTVPDFRFV